MCVGVTRVRHNRRVTAPTTSEQPPNPVLASVVELARAAAQQEAGDEPIGAHAGVLAEDEASVTHLF